MAGELKKKKYEMDMCNGPIFQKMLLFSLPLMLSGILQLLFNAADIIVVGRFAGKEALAAVGSTGSLINLITNLFLGLSVGVNVLVARYFGSGQKKELKGTVHTAIAIAALAGLFLALIGVLLAKPALQLMDSPEDVIDKATLYLRIYFCGMPIMLLYNFGSAILRAIGDTRRPLYYLTLAGVVNVVMNLIFVIVFHMGVAGVAIATVMSWTVSAILVLRALIQSDGDYRLIPGDIRIYGDHLLKIIQIGVPAGIQGTLFAVSNVLIQSSINSFGSVVMAGNTASGNLEGFVYTAMNAVYQATISFTGQNYGAMKFRRIGKILRNGMLIVFSVGLIGVLIMLGFGNKLLLLYSTDPAVIEIGMLRLKYLISLYFLCGMMEVVSGVMRGMGHAILPTLVSLSGACAFRVIWVMTIFRSIHTLDCLYLSYPISWALTILAHLISFLFVYRKLLKNYPKDAE